MIGRLILPLCKKDWLVYLSKLLSKVLSWQSAIHGKALSKLSNILNVKASRILLQMLLPKIDAIFRALI